VHQLSVRAETAYQALREGGKVFPAAAKKKSSVTTSTPPARLSEKRRRTCESEGLSKAREEGEKKTLKLTSSISKEAGLS